MADEEVEVLLNDCCCSLNLEKFCFAGCGECPGCSGCSGYPGSEVSLESYDVASCRRAKM